VNRRLYSYTFRADTILLTKKELGMGWKASLHPRRAVNKQTYFIMSSLLERPACEPWSYKPNKEEGGFVTRFKFP